MRARDLRGPDNSARSGFGLTTRVLGTRQERGNRPPGFPGVPSSSLAPIPSPSELRQLFSVAFLFLFLWLLIFQPPTSPFISQSIPSESGGDPQ